MIPCGKYSFLCCGRIRACPWALSALRHRGNEVYRISPWAFLIRFSFSFFHPPDFLFFFPSKLCAPNVRALKERSDTLITPIRFTATFEELSFFGKAQTRQEGCLSRRDYSPLTNISMSLSKSSIVFLTSLMVISDCSRKSAATFSSLAMFF